MQFGVLNCITCNAGTLTPVLFLQPVILILFQPHHIHCASLPALVHVLSNKQIVSDNGFLIASGLKCKIFNVIICLQFLVPVHNHHAFYYKLLE